LTRCVNYAIVEWVLEDTPKIGLDNKTLQSAYL